MAVDAFAVALGEGEFFHHLGIAMHDAGEIHHFGEVEERVVAAEFLDGVGAHHRAGGFERRGGNAGWDAKVDFERREGRLALHVAHALDAEHIGDLVGIGDGGGGSVDQGQSGEFGRGEHRAFDVHMRIDKAGTEERGVGDGGVLFDAEDFSVADGDGSGKDSFGEDVDDLAGVAGFGVHG